MIRVAIIGAGSHGQHIGHYLNQSGKFQVAGFYDDFQEKGSNTINGSILGNLQEVKQGFQEQAFDQLLIGVGYNHMHFRQQLFNRFTGSIPFATYVHATCYLDPTVSLGECVVVLPGCVLDRNVQVKNNVFFNIGCMVAHDTIIRENCFFAPAVKIAGFVEIESNCFLGIGTTILNHIRICAKTNTGGNCTITKNINKPGTYVGTPARLIN